MSAEKPTNAEVQAIRILVETKGWDYVRAHSIYGPIVAKMKADQERVQESVD